MRWTRENGKSQISNLRLARFPLYLSHSKAETCNSPI